MGVLSWSLSIPLIAPYNYRRAAPPERVGDRESRDSEIAPTDKPKKTIVKGW